MFFLHVGSDELREDKFISICDTNAVSDIKPSGGLWLTKFDSSRLTFNIWVDYLLEHPNVFFSKNRSGNIYKMPCFLIDVDPSKIFFMDSIDKYNYLISNYSNGNGWISFEKLQNYYDGISFEYNFLKNVDSNLFEKIHKSFCVNSLILFNTNPVNYCQSGVVDVEYFDLARCKYEFHNYVIKIDGEKKSIGECKFIANPNSNVKKR